MRLAVTADLHWGLSARGDAATRALAHEIARLRPEVFVIAGDVGEGEQFARCLDLFAGVECARLVLPGNHDLWTRNPAVSSLDLYEELLPRRARESGFAYLDAGPFLNSDGRVAVVGSINWYDYSFADPALERDFPDVPQMYARKLFPAGAHNDGRFVRLGMPDEEFTARVVSGFREQASQLPASVERVIVAQHHPPLRELFYPTAATTAEQRFWLAYTGNRRMEAAVLGVPGVGWVFCGHTHAALAADVEGRRCRNVGGDYGWKRLILIDTLTGEEHAQEFR